MRAISLWQPWASAVALGSKRIETRHWPTDYRGPLAIHAAKRKVVSELIRLGAHWGWQGAFYDSLRVAGGNWVDFVEDLPFGVLVAVCALADCRPSDSFTVGELDTPRKPKGTKLDIYNWTERQMGNFEPGRFGWVLTDVRPLPTPIPFVGRQGFFNVPDELVAEKAVVQVIRVGEPGAVEERDEEACPCGIPVGKCPVCEDAAACALKGKDSLER